MYTNAGRIRPVLEGSLLFLLVILFLLALGRQKLLGGAGLREGGGHELTDVSSFCLDQLLYRSYIKKQSIRTDMLQQEILKKQGSLQIYKNSSVAYVYHREAPQPS